MDLIWRSEKIIKSGDFCHFAAIAPNFLCTKIYPNKVFQFCNTATRKTLMGWFLLIENI